MYSQFSTALWRFCAHRRGEGWGEGVKGHEAEVSRGVVIAVEQISLHRIIYSTTFMDII